jgi:hypothetical protein
VSLEPLVDDGDVVDCADTVRANAPDINKPAAARVRCLRFDMS